MRCWAGGVRAGYAEEPESLAVRDHADLSFTTHMHKHAALVLAEPVLEQAVASLRAYLEQRAADMEARVCPRTRVPFTPSHPSALAGRFVTVPVSMSTVRR